MVGNEYLKSISNVARSPSQFQLVQILLWLLLVIIWTTVLYLLSFFQLLYWTLNKKINISRPYQNFQKTKQKNNHCLLLYFLMFQFIPIPNNHRLDVEKNKTLFSNGAGDFNNLPFHLQRGVKSSNPLRPFCPTSSCRTVSTNWWVKPVVMPAMRCCGRFRSLG